ncbi:MAG TPA: MFS transporter, partial [Symbiobacteriaceae bacterium]|nr:MFS transporter [Symbiobacteriaceae bacterium]
AWQTYVMFGGAALLLSIFLYIETRVPEPVLDLSLFKNRVFTVMNLVGFLQGAGMFGAIVFVPWFIQGVVGVDPNQAGNVMTPMMLTVVVFSVLAGRIALKFPYRYQISAGFVILATGFYLMTGWSVNTTLLQATLSTMVIGAGLGLIMPILALAVQNAFPASRRGVVTSASTFFRSVGGTVGITIFGVIFNNQMAAKFPTTVAPVLGQIQAVAGGGLPPQATAFFSEAARNPQSLIGILLRDEARAAMPPAVLQVLSPAVKLMMSEALHVVFWSGMAVVVVGLLTVQFLGNISLKQQTDELGDQALSLEHPVIAD